MEGFCRIGIIHTLSFTLWSLKHKLVLLIFLMNITCLCNTCILCTHSCSEWFWTTTWLWPVNKCWRCRTRSAGTAERAWAWESGLTAEVLPHPAPLFSWRPLATWASPVQRGLGSRRGGGGQGCQNRLRSCYCGDSSSTPLENRCVSGLGTVATDYTWDSLCLREGTALEGRCPSGRHQTARPNTG